MTRGLDNEQAQNRQGQAVEYSEFTRYSDGSACFTEGGFIHGNDNAADAWRHTLAHLAALGFEELEEAKARGLVPPDWQTCDGVEA